MALAVVFVAIHIQKTVKLVKLVNRERERQSYREIESEWESDSNNTK